MKISRNFRSKSSVSARSICLNALIVIALIISNIAKADDSFPIKQWKTKNGTEVLFYPSKQVPMVQIGLAFRAGSAYDKNLFGISALVTNLLDQGSNNQDATTIAEKLANTGAQFAADTSRDMVLLSLKSLSNQEKFNDALAVFADIVTSPNFALESFSREKAQLMMAINHSQESPAEVANNAFFANLYQNHPYAHPVIGTRESIKLITIKDVKEFYKKYFVAQNAVLVIVGDLDEAYAQKISDQVLKRLPKGQQAPTIEKAKTNKKDKVFIDFQATQTFIRMGQLGIDHHNPDYFPLMVGNYILGGGTLVSRLAEELREKRGLTYGVYSQFLPLPGVGPFMVSFSTKKDQAQKAISLTHKTINDFLAKGPDNKELEAAKKYLIGSFPLGVASNADIAGILIKIAFYSLPLDYLDTYRDNIKNVTITDIKRAFKNNMHPDKMILVEVGTK